MSSSDRLHSDRLYNNHVDRLHNDPSHGLHRDQGHGPSKRSPESYYVEQAQVIQQSGHDKVEDAAEGVDIFLLAEKLAGDALCVRVGFNCQGRV